jgi:hypothetical protein
MYIIFINNKNNHIKTRFLTNKIISFKKIINKTINKNNLKCNQSLLIILKNLLILSKLMISNNN